MLSTAPDGGKRFRVLGIAGSLRQGSYNKALIRAAAKLASDRLEVIRFDLENVPLFNQDVEDRGDPPAVVEFKDAIKASDGILIATPEYQGGLPGVLKNALDWGSRPPRSAPLTGKPVAIMGATPGSWGTVRAQVQLREVLFYNKMPLLKETQVLVKRAAEKFDENLNLVDEDTQKFLSKHMEKFADWVRLHLQFAAQRS